MEDEDSTSNPGPSRPCPGTPKKTLARRNELSRDQKEKHRAQKYRADWENLEVFKHWLKPGKSEYKAKCIVCDCVLLSEYSVLKIHSTRQKHLKALSNAKIANKQRNLMTNFVTENPVGKNKLESKIELMLSAYIAEHNISYNSIDHLTDIINDILYAFDVKHKISLKRTKATAVTTEVIGKAEKSMLTSVLTTQKFSTICDESTDISTQKASCIVVRYFDKDKKQVVSKMWELCKVFDSENPDMVNQGATDEEKQSKKQEYELHLKEKNWSRIEKEKVKTTSVITEVSVTTGTPVFDYFPIMRNAQAQLSVLPQKPLYDHALPLKKAKYNDVMQLVKNYGPPNKLYFYRALKSEAVGPTDDISSEDDDDQAELPEHDNSDRSDCSLLSLDSQMHNKNISNDPGPSYLDHGDNLSSLIQLSDLEPTASTSNTLKPSHHDLDIEVSYELESNYLQATDYDTKDSITIKSFRKVQSDPMLTDQNYVAVSDRDSPSILLSFTVDDTENLIETDASRENDYHPPNHARDNSTESEIEFGNMNQGRKRRHIAEPKHWKRNLAKIRRMKGEDFLGYSRPANGKFKQDTLRNARRLGERSPSASLVPNTSQQSVESDLLDVTDDEETRSQDALDEGTLGREPDNFDTQDERQGEDQHQEEYDQEKSQQIENDEEKVHGTTHFDVATWPTPMPDDLRVEIVKAGSEPYQNRDGPFVDTVQRSGDKIKGKSRHFHSEWFYKALPNGEKVLRKWTWKELFPTQLRNVKTWISQLKEEEGGDSENECQEKCPKMLD
ncbi:unnamed protein product [Spodoptera littoralis]|uniref:Uncharacterized protein n=1 Tax=Spodoptera littoralis TaxID=7109 RepID=A0A9P0I435_SPOLI|nr:unnamed protein product [Spodoptera littoralis]CAH1640743.1 unnamed protein product [Spodoptera littoralis]